MTNIRNTAEYDEIRKTTEYTIGYNDGYQDALSDHGIAEEDMTQKDPFEQSVFTWSFFGGVYDDFFEGDSEYATAYMAEDASRFEPGQIAFDTNEPVDKAFFGIYADDNDGINLTADILDKSNKHLVGCATVKDWEWQEATGAENFDKGAVLDALNSELEDISDWINAQRKNGND